jgi:phenylacetate-CoA ligase
LIFNKEMETMDPQELKRLQYSRLKHTVDRVYGNVSFYQEKFKELGITPGDILSLDDIQKLPFTKKQDLRDNYPFGLFASELKDVVRLHASSGTSGKPTVVGYSKSDIDNWSDLVARCIAAAGGEPGDMFHNAYGYGLFTGGLGIHYGAEKLGVTTVPVSGGNTARQMLLIEDFKPRGIGGTPSYVLNIAEQMEEMGVNPKESSLEYGIFGAEPWTEEMRKTIETKLGIKAVDIYGLSEIIGPGVSIECHEAQDGLHIAEDHFYVEVINPDTLEPVADGEDGELVFTSLTKEAFPILRYRTGDISSIAREKCVCGRTTTRMARVKGRIDDMLIIRGVNVFPSEIEKCLLDIEVLTPHYQIHITKDGHMDKIELNVEITEHIFREAEQDITHEHIAQIKKNVQQAIKEQCLVSMNVNILAPKSIPRSEGKAVRIVDERKKQTA